MRYKKYLVLLVFIMLFNINNVYAVTTIDENDTIKMDVKETIMFLDDANSANVDTSCDGIFGKKDDPDSLRYLINEILLYPKYIVPIIIVGLGTLDFAKAVTAGKEDEMKKAQSTFIKRLFIGMTIFLVPIFMNIIMYLTDVVWNGTFTTCGL